MGFLFCHLKNPLLEHWPSNGKTDHLLVKSNGVPKQKNLNNLSQKSHQEQKGDKYVYLQYETNPLIIILLFFKNTGCLKKQKCLIITLQKEK